MKPTKTKRTLTKSTFRQFNRKTTVWQHEKVALIADRLTRAGKAFLDSADRLFISHTVLGRTVIIVIPAPEVRGWCGTLPHPRPLPFPPPPRPEPDPCPTWPHGTHPVWLSKEERKTAGGYLSSLLKSCSSQLHIDTLGSGFHSITLGGKAILLVMGKL